MNNTATIDFDEIFSITTEDDNHFLEFKKGVKNIIILDKGANHTGFGKSSLSKIDGIAGKLFYKGQSIEEVIDQMDFVDLAYFLIAEDHLNQEELKKFKANINEYFILIPEIKATLDALALNIHPMDFLMVGVTALSGIQEKYVPKDADFLTQSKFMIVQMFVIAAYYCMKLQKTTWDDQPSDAPIYQQFLHQIFRNKAPETIKEQAAIFNRILILHAEHGQNCSTSTVRNIASAGGDIYTAVASGIAAFKGNLHGGASQNVSEMYKYLLSSKQSVQDFVNEKLHKRELIYGFGHRIYRNWDPRARIMYQMLSTNAPVYKEIEHLKDLAFQLVEEITTRDYFKERRIFPNPDLFNNIFYTLFGVPSTMNTVMLSLCRVVGWLSHYKEYKGDKLPIIRPPEIYK